MALLDLQGMDQKPSAGATRGGNGKSASSKGCHNVINVDNDSKSGLSLLIC